MAEVTNKKSGGNFRPQSPLTIGRNKRLKGERQARREAREAAKQPKVPRGTARNKARAFLHQKWAAKPE